ncbi:FkbM family methyltransferase [Rhizobium sp. YIM 134829]|uniref:FkbM family methyltransferase n=1 Tax=Rhizobium sp. YIM 134829 TaxID=3390453 RepID=UPI00397BE7D1
MTPLLARWRRSRRKLRNRLARRFFATRYGRELLIQCISPKVLSMTADCGDHVMSFSPHDYIGRKIYRKGQFERDHVDRLIAVLAGEGLLPSAGTLLEVGANIGTQSLYFALSGHFARVVSIEPDPRNAELLARNIADNGMTGRIVPVRCAAGETEGTIDFYQHRDNHGKSSAVAAAVKGSADKAPNRIPVPVRPVTRILADLAIPPEEVDLIWMDIEGYEPVAARSMTPLLARRTPFYLEFSPVFYGPEATRLFAGELARHYDRCILFHEDRLERMRVSDIPLDRPQFDLLLLP